MVYTEVTAIAMRLCYEAHKDQLDKSGVPYVFHPIHLAEQMETEHEVCTALLHDVIEDTPLTARDLADAGIPEAYVRSVELMTHDEGVPYMEYVEALAHDPVARKVKAADLRHNSDTTRLCRPLVDEDERRLRKYAAALALLEGPEACRRA